MVASATAMSAVLAAMATPVRAIRVEAEEAEGDINDAGIEPRGF